MAARRPSRENDHLPAACQGCWKTDTPVYLRATMAAENLSREETQHGPLTSVTPLSPRARAVGFGQSET